MLEKFVKAVVQGHSEGYTLKYTCLGGAAAEGQLEVGPTTTYPDRTELQVGHELLFCLGLDGAMIDSIYPYGAPLGDPTRQGGGKGKGQLIDVEQTIRTSPPPDDKSEESAEYGIEGRAVAVNWINGVVPASNMTIFTVLDPGINLIPSGVPIHFHMSIDPDGNYAVHYVNLCEGHCDDPMS